MVVPEGVSTLTLTDLAGRTLATYSNLVANQPLTLGGNLAASVYVLHTAAGNLRIVKAE